MPIPALVGLGLGAYGAYQGAKQQKKADGLNAEALATAKQQYADRAPFREYSTAGLGQLGARDSSGIFGDPGNPYAAARDYTTDMGAQSFTPPPTDPNVGQNSQIDGALAAMQNVGFFPDNVKAKFAAQMEARRPQSAPPQTTPQAAPTFPSSAQQQMPGGMDPRRQQSMKTFLDMLRQGR